LIMGFQPTYLIRAAAELGVADHLAAGPLSSESLGTATGVKADALHRVLRGLVQCGVLTAGADGRFSLTPVGELLRSDVPGSMRSTALLWGHAIVHRPYLEIVDALQSGEVAFERAFGLPFFDYLAAHRQEGAIFDRGMAGGTASRVDDIVTAYDFSSLQTIVDVGGGTGALLAAILAAHPALHGIILDLPHVRAEAERTIAETGLDGRCRFEVGNCFEAVPAADAHIMKSIIHDWNDADSMTILRNCRRSLPPHGRLLIIDRVMPPDGAPAGDTVQFDIHMLMVLKGRERTEADFHSLLEASGFRLVRIAPLLTGMCLIEGAPL
jgi:SAM-dependent methyltransferase